MPPAPPKRRGLARRLASLALGLIATLLLLELALAILHRGFLWQQARQNTAGLSGAEGELRILCVGESTTAVAGDETGALLVPATAYPAQLEEILSARHPEQTIRVLNDGVMGGTSTTALELLEATLPELRPHVIIAMMGIKDSPDEPVGEGPGIAGGIAGRLRTLQLVRWLLEDRALRDNAHITDIRTWSDLPAAAQASRPRAGAWVKEARAARDPEGLDQLRAAVYLWEIGRLAQAEGLLRETTTARGIGFTLLAQVLASGGRMKEADALLAGASAAHPDEGMYPVQRIEFLIASGETTQAAALLVEAEAAAPGFAHADLMRAFLGVLTARLQLRDGDPAAALASLDRIRLAPAPELGSVLPPLGVLLNTTRGEAYAALQQWPAAEREFLAALQQSPRQHAAMWQLSRVYRATGQTRKEEDVRRGLISDNGRMAEYFELAKLFQLTGQADRVPEVLATAAAEIPSLKASYARLYALARAEGARLVVMQYPGFPLDAVHAYAPADPDVVFIDNLHLFDPDPDRYLHQPTFPQSFTHYTKDGARLLAEHVADDLEPVVWGAGQ